MGVRFLSMVVGSIVSDRPGLHFQLSVPKQAQESRRIASKRLVVHHTP
jgi:hypothetical protein